MPGNVAKAGTVVAPKVQQIPTLAVALSRSPSPNPNPNPNQVVGILKAEEDVVHKTSA